MKLLTQIGHIRAIDGRIGGEIDVHEKPHSGQSNAAGRPEIRGRRYAGERNDSACVTRQHVFSATTCPPRHRVRVWQANNAGGVAPLPALVVLRCHRWNSWTREGGLCAVTLLVECRSSDWCGVLSPKVTTRSEVQKTRQPARRCNETMIMGRILRPRDEVTKRDLDQDQPKSRIYLHW